MTDAELIVASRRDPAAFRDHVRRRVEATGRSVTFEVRQREPDGELMDARQQRYQAGCAIVVGVGPAGDAGPDVVARITYKGR